MNTQSPSRCLPGRVRKFDITEIKSFEIVLITMVFQNFSLTDREAEKSLPHGCQFCSAGLVQLWAPLRSSQETGVSGCEPHHKAK